MDKDTPNIVLETTSGDPTMENVLKNIYTSCDPQNLNMVPTSEIIEFIRPYLLEDLSALETLRNMLDPDGKNVSVAGEKFFNIMNEWTQKIGSHSEENIDGEFNQTPSQLNVLDDKLLPYTQSTPRASFGQKLLNCEGLLNLSNVSSYNLSPTKQAKDISLCGPEKTILEEEVKQLQHQLNKVLSEMEMLKVQLAYSEEQNEVLQEQLEKCKLRSQSGQQVNENVQENKTCLDDLREEIVQGKKRIEELNKKLSFYEKDNMQLNQYAQKLEKENVELEEQLVKTKQNLENEILGLRTELEIKDNEIATIAKINDELRMKLCEKMAELEQVSTEYEVLDYKQQDLKKLLSSKRYSLSSHYNSCLDEMSSYLAQGNTIPIYSSPIKNKSISNNNSPLTKKVLSPTPKMLYQVLNSSTPKSSNSLGMRKAFSLNTMSTRSLPNIFCFERSNIVQDQIDGGEECQPAVPNTSTYESLQTELFQVDPQFDHKEKNGLGFDHEEQITLLKKECECLQKRIDTLEEENKLLTVECNNVRDKTKDLEKKLSNLMLEKEEMKTEKIQTVKRLEDTIRALKDEIKTKSDELKNKFDFEPVYKNLEIEFANKVAQIDKLKSIIKSLESRPSNISLEPNKKVLKTKENETDILSKEITNLKEDLQDKNNRNKYLQDVLKKENDTKNQIWSTNNDLQKSLDKCEANYNEIKSKYKVEVDKNCELSMEISIKNRLLSETELKSDEFELKYNEELQKNNELQNQVSLLKKEADNIKENQKICKGDILKKLTEYENSLQTFYQKIKDLENENKELKTTKGNIKFANDLEHEDSGVRSELETEVERNKKYSEEDASSESSVSCTVKKPLRLSKTRSFERQKLTIEKLRNDLFEEKSKNQTLKDRLGGIVEQCDCEKLKTVIGDLNKKLNQQEDYYKHICSASNEKIGWLSQELTSLNEKHENTLITVTEKENLLKRTYEAFEHNKGLMEKLDKDVEDFKHIQNKLSADLAAKALMLKDVSLENQNLKRAVNLSDNKLVELSSQIFKQETALKNYQLNLAEKNEEISNLYSILKDRDDKIQVLSSQAVAYEIKMSNILLELAEKDESYAKLENDFKLLNEKLTDTEISTLTPEKFLKADMEMVNGHGNEHTTLDRISNFMDVISDSCHELNGSFSKFVDQWKKKLETHPNFKDLPTIKLCHSLNVEDVLSIIIDNIRTVITLMNITSSTNMDGDTETVVDFLANQRNMNSEDPKNIKRFTLRPATLQLSRPVSPDSPGIEINDIEYEQNDMECRSPDSQTFKSNFESFSSKGETDNYHRYSTLPLLSFDLPLQDAFPRVSDTILEKLGLHESSPKVKLTKEETEEIFTSFAIQVGLDSKDIRDRLQKQKNLCTQKYKKYQYLLKDISMRLRDHNCIGSKDSINPVFVMLEDIRFMMQELMQSAGQLGVLTCELRMTKCWNLVTNYMAILKQDLENTKSLSNRSPTRIKSAPSLDVKLKPKLPKPLEKGNTKEKKSVFRNCLSNFIYCGTWMMLVLLILFIGVICVHWQCKMTTEYKICPLDDFIKMVSQRVGSPPY